MQFKGAPAPNVYNPGDLKPNAPKYSIPAEVHKPKINENPGPGSHDAQHHLVKSKSSAYNMAYKYESVLEEKRNLPGVGQYDVTIKPNITRKRSMFGTSNRPSLSGDPSIPGPGDYETRPKSSTEKKQTFSRAKRTTVTQLTPAPNAYDLKTELEKSLNRKKGFSLAQKLGLKLYQNQAVSPGPGTYDQKGLVEAPDAPSFSVGKEKRGTSNKQKLPGPADYNYGQKYHVPNGTMPRSPGHMSFGNTEKLPGPGHYYDVPTTTTSFSIPRSKSLLTVRNTNPGPGQYNAHEGMATLAIKSSKIGNSLRSNPVRKIKPGPGDYNVLGQQPSRYQGISIGKDARKHEGNDHPGPGHYALQSTISNLSRYAMVQRNSVQ